MEQPIPPPPPRVPIWIFALQVCYLVTLATIGLAYIHWEPLRQLVPDPLGPVPLSVPWWGALGGVTISFTGIFRNSDKWKPRYELWHIARPFLGAVVGSVAYLIFIVVIRTTGAVPNYQTTPNEPVFDLVAFLTGYREDVFRALLKRAADSLFAQTSQTSQTDQEPSRNDDKS
jgi:hypothetical protein